MKQVAIIGGGLAGLTCAQALKRRGIEPVVFEAAGQAGGRDAGAIFFLSRDLFRNTFKLLDDLGMAGDILEISPHAGQVYKGRVYHHRVASATGLLGFKGLNIADKILLPRMAYLLARRASHLDFHHPETGLEFDDETVASFVRRELSQNVLNYVAGPLISTLFFYGSEETSNWLYLVLAKHMFNTRMSTVRGGVQRIARRLAESLPIVANNAVRTLTADGSDYLIDGKRFSDVVFAVPGAAVLEIKGVAELLSEEDRQFFRECAYQRVVSVRIGTKQPVDGRCYAVSIPRVEKFRAATISFHDYIDPSSVPEGRGLLTTSGGGPDVSTHQLLADLKKLYPIEPEFAETQEW
ncbi:MAG TPA: FAD-dependent oxidoreductase, partial [Terriglobia bacterium]|nr:FAD-dependent oxidoreductase [Terriglobia bacterium]